MNSFKNTAFAMLALGAVPGLMFSGCSSLPNKSPETVSSQARNAAATIDRQEARDRLTPIEAATAKDSLARDHLLQF